MGLQPPAAKAPSATAARYSKTYFSPSLQCIAGAAATMTSFAQPCQCVSSPPAAILHSRSVAPKRAQRQVVRFTRFLGILSACRKLRPSLGDPWSHQTCKNTRIRALQVFHPRTHTLPDRYCDLLFPLPTTVKIYQLCC